MANKYFPQTDDDISKMMSAVGIKSLDELYADVPDNLKLDHEYDIPESMSEIEIRRFFKELGNRNNPLTCFMGAGVYDHYTPSVINYITQRSEFLTSYTPYQAEISQGTLQYIFEFQSMIADLTGMEISNASMYDGCTATAEAMMMAVNASKKRNRVLVSSTLNPIVAKVVKTYAHFHGVDIQMIPAKNGSTDLSVLKDSVGNGDIAGVILGQPNFYGVIEDYTGVADFCHDNKTLMIMNCPASTLAVLKTPGEWGADIAVGDCQSLGMPMNYGGPYLGYMCTKEALVRKMPGRIVGATTDNRGNRTFVLTMQAREQHIRRQKATSNICTNQGIMTLYAVIYLSLMGKKGLREVNEKSHEGACYLYDELIKTGCFEPVFDAPFLNEFYMHCLIDADKLEEDFILNGIGGGVHINDNFLFAVTEMRTKEEIDKLVSIVKKGE
jgi:glycine dehydrogenase subunit 1